MLFSFLTVKQHFLKKEKGKEVEDAILMRNENGSGGEPKRVKINVLEQTKLFGQEPKSPK